VGGGALVRFEGGPWEKNMASKGGPAAKLWCLKGLTKKMPLSLVVTASVIMQTSMPEGQK